MIVANDPQARAGRRPRTWRATAKQDSGDPRCERAFCRPTIYAIQVETDTSDAERDRLRQQVGEGKITGFLWLTDDALANHKIVYSTKEAADFGQSHELRNAMRTAVTKQHLAAERA